MNIKFQQLLPADFHNQSKVWIYQSSRPFLSNEVSAIKAKLKEFAVNWKSHGADVKAFADQYFSLFGKDSERPDKVTQPKICDINLYRTDESKIKFVIG